VKNHAERYMRFLVAVAAALGVAAGVFSFLPTSALAFEIHLFSTSFAGEGEHALSNPQGVAVDEATGEVYVVDSANHRVEIFSSSGAFISAFGTAGTGNGQFEEPTEIAVDNSTGMPGDVYVLESDRTNERVEVFNAKGVYQSQVTVADLAATDPPHALGIFSSFNGIAVDSTGNLWVVGLTAESLAQTYEFPSGGALPGSFRFIINRDTLAGLAIDSSGNFYSQSYNDDDNTTHVLEVNSSAVPGPEFAYNSGVPGGIATDTATSESVYSAQGSIVEHSVGAQPHDQFGSSGPGALVQAAGIAVDGLTTRVYVADAGSNRVDIFEPATLPDTTTEAATVVSGTAVTLHGRVDPDETEVTACQFEYGTEPGVYSGTAACSPTPPLTGNVPVAVSAELNGLTANTTYHYRLAATNANGTHQGSEESFGPPRIDSASAEVNQTEQAGQTNATLRATIDPDPGGDSAATYQFEYGETDSYGTSVPVPAGVIGPGGPVPVTIELHGLKADTTYHYRVVASNEYSQTPVVWPDQTFTTLPDALIEEESVSNVASTSATLEALVNPLGRETTCQFQYVTGASFQSTGYDDAATAPCPTVPGTGVGDVEVSPQHITGLTPGTIYHYRLLVTNVLAIVGPDQTFTTQTAYTSVLPDGREWEMVSPPNKNGALIEPIMQEGVIQAAAAGDAMTYHANAPTEPGAAGYSSQVQVLSTRGVGGWSTKDIALPHPGETDQPEGQGEDYRFFSEDLSLAVVQPFGAFTPASSPQALAPGEASEQTAFLRTDYENGNVNERCTQSCYRPLVTGAPGFANVPPGTKFGEEGKCPDPQGTCGPQAVGMSPDGKHVVLNLGGALYEWSAGKLAPVSVPPGGEALVAGSLPRSSAAISANGSRVVWTEGREDYFIRDLARGETLELGTLELGSGAEFEFLNAEGSRVFLGNGTSGSKVCEVKLNSTTNKLECVTTSLDGDGEVIGISRDGSYVYYVAREVQTTTENSEHAKAELGAPNLYMRHYGGEPGSGGWETPRFIATLTGNDGPDVGGYSSKWGRGDIFSQTSRVSPNGQWLSFMSNNDLTDYDDHDAVSGKPDEEVYLYGAAANRLVCASCNPSGARPVGASVENHRLTTPLVNPGETAYWDSTWLAANIPAWTKYAISSASYQSRYLSDSGRLFFNSHDALVPQDVNGNWDVYEYEPPEVGDCSTASATFSARSDGCVGLISSGESDEESAFLDASETGGDVFFLTTSKLAPQDYDKAFDVYDAHECTGASPCAPPSRVAPHPNVLPRMRAGRRPAPSHRSTVLRRAKRSRALATSRPPPCRPSHLRRPLRGSSARRAS